MALTPPQLGLLHTNRQGCVAVTDSAEVAKWPPTKVMHMLHNSHMFDGQGMLFLVKLHICMGLHNNTALADVLAILHCMTPACAASWSSNMKSALSSLASSASNSCMVGMGPAATCAVSFDKHTSHHPMQRPQVHKHPWAVGSCLNTVSMSGTMGVKSCQQVYLPVMISEFALVFMAATLCFMRYEQ